MQIQSHNLQLASERNYNRSEEQHEQLRIGRVSQDPVTGARQVDTLFEASHIERRELLTYSAGLAMNAKNSNNEPASPVAALTRGTPLESTTETAPQRRPSNYALRPQTS
jgi:hypothetical protein